MDNIIYYFSATGNSLNTARKIADKIGKTKLVSIPSVLEKSTIDLEAERIGLVFPIYAWGMPRIINDFVSKLKVDNCKYIFAIATCAGTPGGTLHQLNKVLNKKGSNLDAGFIVKEENHTPMADDNILRKMMMELTKNDIFKTIEERITEIVSIVKNESKHKIESNSWLANFLGNLFHSMALPQFKTFDDGFWIDDNCNDCGTCMKVCPRDNIIKENGHFVWLNNCEYCFACLQWCPNEAIQYKDSTQGIERTHHPEIAINNIIS